MSREVDRSEFDVVTTEADRVAGWKRWPHGMELAFAYSILYAYKRELGAAERKLAIAEQIAGEYRSAGNRTTHSLCVIRKAGIIHGTVIDDRCPTCRKYDEHFATIQPAVQKGSE